MASGSIQKREGKRGVRWSVIYDDPHAVGKRKQRRKTFTRKREAEAFLAKTLDQINTGNFIEPSLMSVGDYLDHWLDTYARHNVRPTTFRSYEQMIRLHVKPTLGAQGLQKLQPAHLQAFYSEKLTSGRADGKPGGLSPRTVQYLHRIVREALQQAFKWQMVGRNVADATEPPRAPRKPPAAWDADQVGRFLAHVEAIDSRDNPIWHLAVTTGLRRGELLGLRWQDLDLDQATLRVRQNLVEVDGRLVFQEPKTKSGRRSVALFPVTVQKLREHRTIQLQQRLQAGPAWDDHDLVFSTPDGKPLYPSNLTTRFRKLVSETDLPPITLHGLRHTHATLMLKDNMHVKIMSERLGHSIIALTLDTYAHVLPDMQRQALEAVDASMFDPPRGLEAHG